MIAPGFAPVDATFGGARLPTNFRAKVRKLKAFVKFCNRFACFTFQHLRKSSSCPTSKFWTFWGSRDKYCTVDLTGSRHFTMKQLTWILFAVWARLQSLWCSISFKHFLACVVVKYRQDKLQHFCISVLYVGVGCLFEQLRDPSVCKQWAEVTFLISMGQKIVNSLQMKYLNLIKVNTESVTSNSILGIHKQKLKQENAFRFESLNYLQLVLNGKEWKFPKLLLSLHYWLTCESCWVICNCLQKGFKLNKLQGHHKVNAVFHK